MMGEGTCDCNMNTANWCTPGKHTLAQCPMKRLSCLWHVNDITYPNVDWRTIRADWCLSMPQMFAVRTLCLFDHHIDTEGDVFDMMEHISGVLEEASYHA